MAFQASVSSRFVEVAKRFGPFNSVYDCGSRDAKDGLILSDKIEAKELHIFECNPVSADVCRRNIAAYTGPTKVVMNELAISHTNGEIDFFPIDTEKSISPHEGGNPGASSLLKANPKYPKETYVQKQISVRSTTLDSYALTHTAPDLLWMDLQGAELSALRGADKILGGVKIIHIEVSFREMYLGQPLFWQIDEFLQKTFTLNYIDLGRWPRILPVYRMLKFGPWVSNAVYVNRSLAN